MPPKKTTSSLPVSKTPYLVIELIGLCLSFFLFGISVKLFGDMEIPCTRNKWFGCESILQGYFSHFGPFSIAVMGVIYYVCHLMLSVGLKDRFAQISKVLLVFGGLIFIAWLRSLELIYIKKICPWCWGVALITLIHAGITYRLLIPPFPRLKLPGLIGSILGGFIVIVGLTSILELGLGIGKIMMNQERKDLASTGGKPIQIERGGEKISVKAPIPIKTPVKETPKATPKTPVPAASSELPTPEVKATPKVTPTPTPATATFDPEPKLNQTAETRILKERGWRHAPSGESVIRAIKVSRPKPVLMLAYDPMCSDCHNLITKVLSNPLLDSLPVTKIAIQESMLSGQINEWVTEIPTMYLIGADGSSLLKIVGSRISAEQLNQEIRSKL